MLSKLVFITGANTGIGYETVKALVQSEKSTYHILIGTRTLAKAYSAIENMKDLLAPSCCTVEAIQIDVGNNESVKAAVKQVQERFGWLDILINNAGMSAESLAPSHR
jgi:NAD(P)-dependent dehydrogenase (short-subunit alcohol dehydrogenase family)